MNEIKEDVDMKYSKLFIFFFVILFFYGTGLSQEEITVETVKLTDKIYRLTIVSPGFSVNMAAFFGSDGLLLVDTGFKESIEQMKSALSKIKPCIPKIIINTHAHIDHTGGNAAFGEEPLIIAHSLLRNRLREGRYVPDEFPDEALPDIIFSNSLKLYFNGEEIRLTAIPGAHDDNNIIIHFTESKIVCTGSIFPGMFFPSVDRMYAIATEYPGVLKKLMEMTSEDVIFLTGHGKECDKDDLRKFYEMVIITSGIVKNEIDKGKDLDKIKGENVLRDFESFSNKEYVTTDSWIDLLYWGFKNIRPKKTIVDLLYYAYKRNGAEGVIRKYKDLKENYSDEYNINDTRLAFISYYLIEKDHIDDAQKIVQFWMDEYPDAGMAYFTMGEIHKMKKNIPEALTYYREALKKDPNNAYASEMIKLLEKK